MDVPQADRLDRVVALALEIVRGKRPRAEDLGLHRRDLRYYAHAAFVLGLVDADDRATPLATKLISLPEAARQQALASAFAATAVARTWAAHAGASLHAIDPASAEPFLVARSELAPSTARRRATTLRNWWITLHVHFPLSAPAPRAPAPAPPSIDDMDDIPPQARELFSRSATPLSPSEVAALRQAVRDHLTEFCEAAHRSELLPLDIAEQLARGLEVLLAQLHSLPAEHRPLVVGAARYFVSHDDARPDLSGLLGLDDDAAVFNHVARRLGRDDLVIEL